jgi:hypothetical protein
MRRPVDKRSCGMTGSTYRAILSSDWNECLAPCGPFDCVFFVYPHLKESLSTIFRQYTANEIALSEAVDRMQRMLPRSIAREEMDAYLEASFVTYPGLTDWMEWCQSHDILFMINTTGMQGYFQRVFAKGFLPLIPALSAHPMLRFESLPSDPRLILDLREIPDKPRNTSAALSSFGISTRKIILMGDSGGDGPHFEWGAKVGALLIGSMTKSSLQSYCDARGLTIHVHWGWAGVAGDRPGAKAFPSGDFMQLVPWVEEYLISG